MSGQLLRVGVWNIERLGWDEGEGHHRLSAAVDWLLEQSPVGLDVLALPEARGALADGQRILRRLLAYPLSQHLPDGGRYEPLLASRNLPGRRNHLHALLVNTAKVFPLAWWDPQGPDAAYRTDGFATCAIFGHEVDLCCEHWNGGLGRAEFDRAVNRLSTHGGPHRQTLILGDFNADSGWEKEQHHGLDWYELCRQRGELHKLEQKGWWNPETEQWEIDTRQLDKLHLFGFRDMGQEAGDPTPTTDPSTGSTLRIDRIYRSSGLPVDVLDYQVRQPPRELSDHALVYGTYRFLTAG